MTNIKDLYLRYQETNQEADFDALYTCLWKLCVRIVGQHTDAEDIASEVAIPLGIKLCKREVPARGLYTRIANLTKDCLTHHLEANVTVKRGGKGRYRKDKEEKLFCTRCQTEGHDIDCHFETTQFEPYFHVNKAEPSVDPYEPAELPGFLTKQERRFVLAVDYGMSFQEWARKEGVSIDTVQRMRNRIITKAAANLTDLRNITVTADESLSTLN